MECSDTTVTYPAIQKTETFSIELLLELPDTTPPPAIQVPLDFNPGEYITSNAADEMEFNLNPFLVAPLPEIFLIDAG